MCAKESELPVGPLRDTSGRLKADRRWSKQYMHSGTERPGRANVALVPSPVRSAMPVPFPVRSAMPVPFPVRSAMPVPFPVRSAMPVPFPVRSAMPVPFPVRSAMPVSLADPVLLSKPKGLDSDTMQINDSFQDLLCPIFFWHCL